MTDLIIILILVAFNGFFSLSEVALISARRSRLQADVRRGSKAARMALDLMDDPDKFLSTAQIGITVVSILTGIYSGEALADDFAAVLAGWGVNATYAPTVSKAIIVVFATYLQCELGELFPKRMGIDMADGMARLTAPLMLFFSKVSMPFVWLLTQNTELLIRMFRLHPEDNKVTEEEIKSVIQEGMEAGEVREVEQDIMERALVLGDQKIETRMTHRGELVTLDIDMTAAEVEEVLRATPFAAYPVVDGSLDEIRGLVTLKDLVLRLHRPGFRLQQILQSPAYFPESMTVYKALEVFKEKRLNRALVCDEFGSLQGIISLKDILEGLVGSIDEPSETPDIIRNADGSWTVSGQCLFYDFLAYFDMESHYSTDYVDAAYNTVAGLILDLLQHLPAEGEELTWKDVFRLRVAKMDGTRIDTVRVERTGPGAAAEENRKP